MRFVAYRMVNTVGLVAVPPGVCTVTVPVVAPAGMVTLIDVPERTLNAVATVPLNFTTVDC
jgi:hypothetical protein